MPSWCGWGICRPCEWWKHLLGGLEGVLACLTGRPVCCFVLMKEPAVALTPTGCRIIGILPSAFSLLVCFIWKYVVCVTAINNNGPLSACHVPNLRKNTSKNTLLCSVFQSKRPHFSSPRVLENVVLPPWCEGFGCAGFPARLQPALVLAPPLRESGLSCRAVWLLAEFSSQSPTQQLCLPHRMTL